MKEKNIGDCDGYPCLLTSLNLELNTQMKGHPYEGYLLYLNWKIKF